jgi:hypothetical protein
MRVYMCVCVYVFVGICIRVRLCLYVSLCVCVCVCVCGGGLCVFDFLVCSFHKELDVEDKELLLSGILSWEVSQNVLYMARIEAATIHELDHLLVEQHVDQCFFLFADGDQYTPGHAVYMQRHWPSAKIVEVAGTQFICV